MANQVAEAFVSFRVLSGGIKSGLNQVRGTLLGGLRGIAGKARGMIGSIFSPGLVKLGALAGMTAGIKKLLDFAGTQEEAETRLEAVHRATGGAVGYTTDQLKAMASELQGVTRFGDETTLQAQAMLLTFKSIQGINFRRTVESAMDIAEVMGTSLTSASMQLGKALEDPIRGLTSLHRAGISFSEQQRQQIKQFMEAGQVAEAQNVVLSAIEGQLGGVSRAMAGTFKGAVAQMSNAIGDLWEVLGATLMPVVREAAGVVKKMAEQMQKLGAPVKEAVGRILLFVGAVGSLGVALPVVKMALGAVMAALGSLLSPLGLVLAAAIPIAGALKRAFEEGGPMVERLQAALERIGAVFEPLLNRVLQWLDTFFQAGPIADDILGTFTEVFESIASFVEENRETFELWIDQIMAIVSNLPGFFVDVFNGISEFFGGILEGMGTNWSEVWQAIQTTVTSVLGVIELLTQDFFGTMRLGWLEMQVTAANVWNNVIRFAKRSIANMVGALGDAIDAVAAEIGIDSAIGAGIRETIRNAIAGYGEIDTSALERERAALRRTLFAAREERRNQIRAATPTPEREDTRRGGGGAGGGGLAVAASGGAQIEVKIETVGLADMWSKMQAGMAGRDMSQIGMQQLRQLTQQARTQDAMNRNLDVIRTNTGRGGGPARAG